VQAQGGGEADQEIPGGFGLGVPDRPSRRCYREPLGRGSEDRIERRVQGTAYGDTNAAGEKWITVHPNGENGAGHPIKIEQNHAGSWRVTGGAGGSLHGLKLHNVKSAGEYKHAARANQTEKK